MGLVKHNNESELDSAPTQTVVETEATIEEKLYRAAKKHLKRLMQVE